MDKILAQWIRDSRKGSIPVENWMIDDEGKDILHNIYPLSFTAPSEFSDYLFKVSNNCQKRLFKRHNFSLRKISKRKNSSTDKKEWTHK